jgi:DNA mismatch repair protein MutS2
MPDQAGETLPGDSQLRRLEFGKVLEEVSGLASSSEGGRAVRSLLPAWEPEHSRELREETVCASSLLSAGLRPPCSGLDALSSVLGFLSSGATVLESSGLRVVGEVLAAFNRFSASLESAAIERFDTGPLEGTLGSLPGSLNGLAGRLLSITTPDGGLSPNASPELARLSRKVDGLQRKLGARIEKIAVALASRGLLRDSPPTLRDGRYVLPVLSSRRRELGGIVHDRSDSGETVFVEPTELVEDGNALREASLDLDFERRRILREASVEVRSHFGELSRGLAAMIALDAIFARAEYHNLHGTVFPEDGSFSLLHLRHPLIPAGEVVGNDLRLPADWKALIISGPNAGGKSVLLKAAGLAVVCAQAGLGAFAGAGSTLPFFRRVFVSIGDQQSISSHQSTYSARLSEQIEMLGDPGDGDLALIDEPAAGTDPLTGAALAGAFLEHLADSGCRMIVTTHMGQLKTLAGGRPGFINGCMNFQGEKLEPDYTFTSGLPGSSFTLEIARRMSYPESIIRRASDLAGDSFLLDRLLEEMADSKSRLEMELAASIEARAEERHRFEKLRERLEMESSELERALARVITDAAELEDRINSRADSLLARLAKAETQTERREIRAEIRTTAAEATASSAPANPSSAVAGVGVVEGSWVTVRGWEGAGRVERLSRQHAVVEMGNLMLRRPLSDLTLAAPPADGAPAADWCFQVEARTEINMLGMTAEEALAELDRSLDDCVTAGLGRLRVIHGKGRGVLMKAVVDYVKHDRRVETFRPGESGEGGMGVTMVSIRLPGGRKGS